MKGRDEKTASQMDIANAMGLSIATISRVLSGKADHVRCVAPETVKAVRATAMRMGYRMNFAGRMLRTRKANAIGLLFSSMSPLYLELVPKLQRRLFSRGYAALCGFWATEDDAGPTISAIVERDVDGIITCHWPDVIGRLAKAIPAVFLLGHNPSCDCVNSAPDCDTLVDYLAGLGHRHIAFYVGGSVDGSRFPGIEIDFVRSDCNIGAFAELFTGKPAGERPTAAVCAGDNTASTLAALLMRQGLRVPGDVSVVGTSSCDGYATSVPPVTTFGVSTDDLATALVDTLFLRLSEPTRAPLQIVLKPSLMVRESTAAVGQ